MKIHTAIGLAGLLAMPVPGGAVQAAGTASPPSGAVCVAVWGNEQQEIAEAIGRNLDVPSRRIDAGDDRQRSSIEHDCGRLIVAVGRRALDAVQASPGKAPILSTVATEKPAAGSDRISSQMSRDLDPERAVELLHRLSPRVRRIGAVFDPAHSAALVEAGQRAARAAGMELVALPAHSIREAVLAFHRFEGEVAVDALWILPDPTTTVQETMYYALEVAHYRSIAVIGLSQWYVSNGALFALVPRKEDPAARVAAVAKQILRGEKPPAVAYSRDAALYLNFRTAQRLGIRIPAGLRDIAEPVAP